MLLMLLMMMYWLRTTNINTQNNRTTLGLVLTPVAFLSPSLSLSLNTHYPRPPQALMTVHYVVMRNRFTEWKMTDNATQTSVSLLRFCDVIPPDKAFYLAGMACRNNKEYESMAFVLLNHYLDISEAIEEGKEDNGCGARGARGGCFRGRHSCFLLFFFFDGCLFVLCACVHCAAPSPQATPA